MTEVSDISDYQEKPVKYLKFALREFDIEPRDTREMEAAADLGMEVFLVCTKMKYMRPEVRSRLTVIEYPLMDYALVKMKPKRWYYIIMDWFRIAALIVELHPDIISAHDYIALLVAYISVRKCKGTSQPKLIYDSHEYELGRRHRTQIRRFLVKSIEGFLIRRSVLTIVPCEPAADRLQQVYHLAKKPVVIKSTPNRWILDNQKVYNIRQMLRSRFNANTSFIMMSHGLFYSVYNLKKIICLLPELEDCALVVMGNENETGYLDGLKEIVMKENVSDKVAFIPAVPYAELSNYVAAADVGLLIFSKDLLNGLYALPNKFFENIQAETPIIASAFPAMMPIIEKYGFGITVDPDNEAEIVCAITRMKNDKKFYAELKENINIAKQELCWENEQQVLKEALLTIQKVDET